MMRAVLWIFSFASFGAVWGQSGYEAYWVADFDRSSTSCASNVCEVRGNVGTVNVPSSLDSSPARATVYSADGYNGAMELLGIAVVVREPQSDRVSVSFRWPQEVQSVIVLYVRHNTSNRDVMLVDGQGRSTRKFLLETQDVCHLCSGNAIHMDRAFGNIQLNVVTAASHSDVTCSEVIPAHCPTATVPPDPTSQVESTANSVVTSVTSVNPTTTETPGVTGGQGIGPVNTALSITFSLVVTLYIVAGVVVLAIVFGILCIIHYRGHEKVEPKCDHNTGSVTPTKDPVTATDIRSSALVEEV